jgi:hypothetical protein
MIKKDFFQLLKSVLITSVISSIVSLACYILWKLNYVAVFALAYILQYVIYMFINDFLIKLNLIKLRELEISKLEQLSTILSCASCSTNNLINFIPEDNSRIEFVCDNCKGNNVVNINFSVARTTELTNNI